MSIGRLERYKGHHRTIEARPELLRRIPDAKLRILGEGPYKRDLLALVERLQLGNHVEIGGVPPSERDRLAAILGSASLVVLLSAYEAHPVSVLEALALGRRVLVTNCSGFIEMAEQGVVETVAPDASCTQIANAMAAALADDRAGATVAGTRRLAMGKARVPVMRAGTASGRCASGCARTGAPSRASCHPTSACSSSRTTLTGAAKPCSAPLIAGLIA